MANISPVFGFVTREAPFETRRRSRFSISAEREACAAPCSSRSSVVVTINPPCSICLRSYFSSNCSLMYITKCGALMFVNGCPKDNSWFSASFACSWVMNPSSTMRFRTCVWRDLAASGLLKGEYLVGACGRPARSDASAKVRSLALLLKYRWDAVSIPYVVPP